MALLHSEGPVFKLGPLIGKGGFAQVFRATEKITGQLVAVKKSRVSLRVNRTLFQHEARVLRSLHGHPSIPAVYAVGRFNHFEYIAMELLGQSLGDIQGQPEEVRKEFVPQVALQMISALEHIHSRGLVHRDIKPDNILLCPHDHRQIRLIDFGLACPYNRESMSAALNSEPDYVLGTLPFISLNAHRGFPLTRRDDLESLAYSLFSILRGSLPWNNPRVHTSTPRSIRRHVYAKKQAWSGTRLAEGYDEVFGLFLDETRKLEFDETPPYDRWRVIFADSCNQRGISLPFDFGAVTITAAQNTSDFSKSPALQPSPCIVEPGQLIYVQLLPRMTIEGYTFGRRDSSYWLDPSLSEEAWPTVPRPAVVLQVSQDWRGKSVVKLTPITCRRLGDSVPKVLLAVDGYSEEAEAAATVLGSAWPQKATWCYTFMHTATFTCNPDQTECVPVHWKIPEKSLNILLHLDASPNSIVTNGAFSKSDEHINAKMMNDIGYFYIKVHSLEPDTLHRTTDGDVVDWESDRGWFDELVPIYRRRAMDLERVWTDQQCDNNDETSLSDSYFEYDLSEWRNVQQECEQSLSLGFENYSCLDAQLPVISAIE